MIISCTLKIPLSRQSIPKCNPQPTGVPLVLAITVTLPTGDSYDASFTTHSDIFSSRSRNHLLKSRSRLQDHQFRYAIPGRKECPWYMPSLLLCRLGTVMLPATQRTQTLVTQIAIRDLPTFLRDCLSLDVRFPHFHIESQEC